MTAYYNEFDPDAAQWLRNLIAAGHIAPGDVDDRSIKEVRPDDLRGYTQCHFFAGIGVWSYALRRAGWPDDRPVWTGSCPCQPFSTAGKGEGLDDPRHLWPDWFNLIRERRPVVVLGEQVSGKDGLAWLDLTRADLEDDSYSTGALVACSAGVGGPDIRPRLYWMAHAVRDGAGHAPGQGMGAQAAPDSENGRLSRERLRVGLEGATSGLAITDEGQRRQGRPASEQASGPHAQPSGRNPAGWMEHTERIGSQGRSHTGGGEGVGEARPQPTGAGADGRPGPLNGLWRAADWIFCTDGKWRPVEPGTFPLATGAAGRVVRLRAYGNAINAEVARVFIECVKEVLPA